MLQLPEKSKNFLQIPLEKTRHGIRVYLKQGDKTYKFLGIKQSTDGSIECVFYNLNSTQKGTAHVIEVKMDAPKEDRAKVVKESSYPEKQINDPYVTYHTSGRVNYHGFTFKEQFFTPLDRIQQPQFFFMVSFCKMDSFQAIAPADCTSKASIIIDISEFDGRRCDFLFAIVP